jgi:hypothetical protein
MYFTRCYSWIALMYMPQGLHPSIDESNSPSLILSISGGGLCRGVTSSSPCDDVCICSLPCPGIALIPIVQLLQSVDVAEHR